MLKIRALAMLLALLALACSSENKTGETTQVLLVVESDLGSDLASVEVRVQDMAGEREGASHTFTLSDDLKLPVSLNIVPSRNKESDTFRVVARGLDSDGELLVESKAYGRFVSGKRVAITLWLRAACRGVICSADQTCSGEADEEGSCIDIPTPGTREVSGPSKEGDDVPALTPPSENAASEAGVSETALDGGSSASPEAGASSNDAQVVVPVPHAENVPTLGAFSTFQEARGNGSYRLFDDGFELGEPSCNGGGLCLTGSFAP